MEIPCGVSKVISDGWHHITCEYLKPAFHGEAAGNFILTLNLSDNIRPHKKTFICTITSVVNYFIGL